MKANIKKGSNASNIIAVLAVVVVVISVLSFVIVIIRVSEFKKEITGFVSSQGYVNITVTTLTSITVGPNTINWGGGGINGTYDNATLTTAGLSGSDNGGNWSTVGITGINISNNGNVNCSLSIQTGKNVTDWWGATAQSPQNYSINVSNKEANSCSGGTFTLARFYPGNKTSMNFCSQFSSTGSSNEVWLDVQLQVPRDLNSTQQNTLLTDTIVISCT